MADAKDRRAPLPALQMPPERKMLWRSAPSTNTIRSHDRTLFMNQLSAAIAAPSSLTNSRIETEYRARTTRSAELYAEACQVIPAGLTHDSRTLLPYPVYAARAAGALK